MRAADELLHTIANCTRIPSVKRRLVIERELRTHVEDFVATARNAGHEEHQVEALLRMHFGDPRKVAEQFAWVYRNERRTILVLSGTASIILLFVCLMLFVLAVQAYCAASLGTPVLRLLESRHTFIEAADILACVSIYMAAAWIEPLFERRRFEKTALLIAAVTAPLIVSGIALDLHVMFLAYGTIAALFLRASRILRNAVLRTFAILACFALAGFGFARLRAPISPAETLATCISWLTVGVGYRWMTYAATRIDAGVLSALQRR